MRVTNSWVLAANATCPGSDSPRMRATWPCALGTTVPKTWSHLVSVRVAESRQYCAWPACVASGQGWWLCAEKWRRPGFAWKKVRKWDASIPLFCRQCEFEAHEHLVGHGIGRGPGAFADLVLQALHRELALDDAHAVGLLEREGRHHVLRRTLDGERARGLVAVATQRFHRRGDEARLGKRRHVEPGLSLGLVVALVGAEVDGAQLDLELGLRRLRMLRVEGHRGVEAVERPLDGNVHLGRDES